MKRSLLFVLCLFLAVTAFADPPFRAREVAVYAAPHQLTEFQVDRFLPYSGISVLQVEPGREMAVAAQLRARGLRAGVNRIATAFATINDPYYSPYQWHLSHVQSNQAWDITNGSGAVVAVLDTGLATGGADGINCAVSPRDVVNGDNNPDDGDGHGTHVSGTVAQKTNNGVGVAGLAWGACIMPVKVLDDSGSGSFADIAEGIYYATDSGADVINMSLGVSARWGMTNDPLVDPALEYAYAASVTVVCAAGNDGSRKNVSYPAIYPTTIAVGATDYNNNIVRYSNRGTGLDVVAPGGDTGADRNGDGYGDGVLQETRIDGGWAYYFFQGTSMSSPHVAAAAALLYATGTATTPETVKNALTSTALDLGSAGYDSTYGHGLIQAYAALTGGGSSGCTDDDGDGWCISEGDCDDTNGAVNPGAAEVCGDGIDNNCDGTIDEGCEPSCTDDDGDGWCVSEGDCDDSNAAVNPGAEEVCGDGIDNNCDGTIDEGCDSGGCTDNDGDGWTTCDGDCDDNDSHVYPGHNDTKGKWGRDGVDNDCNGIIDG